MKVILLLMIVLISSCDYNDEQNSIKSIHSRDNVLYQLSQADLPSQAVEKIVKYYVKKARKIKNKRYISVVDFTKASDQKRFYLFDLKTTELEQYLVAHGTNSGSERFAVEFSNVVGSRQSSLGFYLTGEKYYGEWKDFGASVRLHGQESSNSKAFRRYIVLHGYQTTNPEFAAINRYVEPTYGCFGMNPSFVTSIVNKIKNGSLMYAFYLP